jgi:hypothetical protein
MAFPTIRSSNSGALTTAGLSLTVTLPTGHAQGDLLIIGVSLDGSRTMTAPTDWTLLANPTNSAQARHAVWWKIRGSSESNPSITWVTTTELGTWYSIAITVGTWSGVPEIATAYGATANPNAPSLTPSWGSMDTLWLALHGWDYNRTSSTNPSSFTLLTYQAGSSTASAGHRTHYRAVAAASQDPSQITISATDEWYAHTVAIKPFEPPNLNVNIGGVWKQAVQIYVNIDGTWRLASDYFVNIAGVWKNVGTYAPPVATVWTYIGTTGSNNGSVNGGAQYLACADTSTLQSWLTSNYPPSGYSVGYIMRVNHNWYDDEMMMYTCVAYFYEATS